MCRPYAGQRRVAWLAVALEETAVPALMMIASVSLIAVALPLLAPGATTIVDVWIHAVAGR